MNAITRKLLTRAVLILLLGATTAAGSHDVFTNEADFILAASFPLEMESFEGLPVDNRTDAHQELLLDGFLLQSNAQTLSVWDHPCSWGGYATDGVQHVQAGSTTLQLDFFLSQPAEAFGVNIIDWGDWGPGTLVFSLDGMPLFNVAVAPLPNNNQLFAGAISSMSFDRVTLNQNIGGEAYSVDEVYYGLGGIAPDNWGFETGDFAEWDTVVPAGADADVCEQHTDDDGDIYEATEGTYFACVKTDGPRGPTVLSRSFTAAAGANLEFDWFFDARDYGPFDDYLRYRVEDAQGAAVHSEILASIMDGGIAVGDHGETGWNRETYTFVEDGEYTFYFEITNDADSILDSYAGIDNVVIPEPATLSLLVLGGLAMLRRKRW